jgi:RNA polymerase sigma factor (sigma-70 family)
MEATTSGHIPQLTARASGRRWGHRASDEALARRAGTGDEGAFAALYERYHQPLYGYCRSIVRHDSDAQDVLQSTFVRALAALRRQARNAPVRPWLFRIAHNEAISLLRRRTRDRSLVPVHDAGLTVPGSDEAAAQRARWAELTGDLAALPERARGALLLRELAGLSHEEIGTALETSPGAARQAIFEARQALAEMTEGRAMRCEDVRRRISDSDGRKLRARAVRAHLADCGPCAEFAAGIRGRETTLRASAPWLPAAAAPAILARVIGGGGHSGAATGAGTVASSTALGKLAGGAAGWKLLAGAAVMATAGAAGLTVAVHRHTAAPEAADPVVHMHAAPPAGVTGTRAEAIVRAGAAARAVAPRVHRAGATHSTGSRSVGHHVARRGPAAASTRRHGPPAAAVHPDAPGNSAAAPGHTKAAAPGSSATAPGHTKATPPGRSATAPGHTKAAAPGHTHSTAHGNSATAPRHTKTAARVHTKTAAPSHAKTAAHGNSAHAVSTASASITTVTATITAPSANTPPAGANSHGQAASAGNSGN